MRALLALLLLLGQLSAHAADWRSAEGSSFSFETRFEGEPLKGSFKGFEVRVRFDPDKPEDAELSVTVDLAAADMGDPDMNAVLFDPAWFDVGQFATATYRSSAISPAGVGYSARGALDLKGFSKAVSVPFQWQRDGAQARMNGQFRLLRTDFGVGSGEWSNGDSVGLEVELRFDILLEAVK